MFSKACEYGIRATLFIAKESIKDNRVGLKQISKAIDSPEAFTAKILQKLVQEGLIHSLKGPTGGFYMDNEKDILLLEIVSAIDGDTIYNGCALGLEKCSEEQPCPVHHEFYGIRSDLKNMLANTTVNQLTSSLESGQSFLKL